MAKKKKEPTFPLKGMKLHIYYSDTYPPRAHLHDSKDRWVLEPKNQDNNTLVCRVEETFNACNNIKRPRLIPELMEAIIILLQARHGSRREPGNGVDVIEINREAWEKFEGIAEVITEP